jgi:glucans biosynthesis protein
VRPEGAWGRGRVELVQLPTPNEFNDNIVAFFVPATMPALREPLDFAYRIGFQSERETRPPQAFVTQSRRGVGPNHGPNAGMGFVVDFDGPALSKLAQDAPFEAVVTIDSNAELLEQMVARNDVTSGARLTLRIRRRDDAKPVELRAYLKQGDTALSETWSYLLPPG